MLNTGVYIGLSPQPSSVYSHSTYCMNDTTHSSSFGYQIHYDSSQTFVCSLAPCSKFKISHKLMAYLQLNVSCIP